MKTAVALVLFVLASFAAAAVGSQFLPGPWYAALEKPAWNPPAWVFGPVWTFLYLLIGVSAWLVWREEGLAADGGRAMPLWVAQLVLNAAWSWIFFGLQRSGLALIEILLLWLAILATIWSFRRVSRTAALLLLPYLAWVSFAAVLNGALWRLNS
jgi:tryptophan-rich sensory protein